MAQQFNPEDSDAVPPKFNFKPTRTQRIIDGSNGISADHKGIFTPMEQPKSQRVKGKGPQPLYQTRGEMLRDLRPGLGRSKLRDINKDRLPELNTSYGESYFKRIRKDLFADRKEVRGTSSELKPLKSVDRV